MASADQTREQQMPETAVTGTEMLQASQLQLFQTGAFSDMTILCRDRTWNVHSCIVAPRCKFFHACSKHGHQEDTSGALKLHDDAPDAIKHLLEHFYTLKLPTLMYAATVENALSLIHLMCVADKYDVPLILMWAKDKAEIMILTGDFETHQEFVQAVYREETPVILESLKATILLAATLSFGSKALRERRRALSLANPEYAADLQEELYDWISTGVWARDARDGVRADK